LEPFWQRVLNFATTGGICTHSDGDNDDDDKYIYAPTFKEQDDISMKLMPFPQLKNVLNAICHVNSALYINKRALSR